MAVGHIVQVRLTHVAHHFTNPHQMSHIASLSSSQMGLATTIWGYLRFFIQIETGDGLAPILFITQNLATDTAGGDGFRKDKSLNFVLLCQIYFFVTMVLLKTQGPRILPPDLRENNCLLNFLSPTINKRSSFVSCCWLLPRPTSA